MKVSRSYGTYGLPPQFCSLIRFCESSQIATRTQAYRFPANIRVTSEDFSCSHQPPNPPCLHPRSHEEGRLFIFRHICYWLTAYWGVYDRQVRGERKYLTGEAGRNL